VGSRDKPDAQMYRSAIDFLGGGDPGAVMMVAAHNSDLVHAASHGMPTAFISRPYEHGAKQSRDFKAEHEFTVVAKDFVELAEKMGA
jgi:2-haloacid dehalogenase